MTAIFHAFLGYLPSTPVEEENLQQSDLMIIPDIEFILVNTFDFAISILQMYVLKYYFTAWRKLAKEKEIDKYISITFTCLALATVIRFFGTMLKCMTNFLIWSIPEILELQAWKIRHGIFLKELIRSFSIVSVFTRNIGIAFNLTRWILFYKQNIS